MRLADAPTNTDGARRLAFVALFVLFAGRLVFAALILPPWQNPDETAHLAVVRAFAKYPSIDLTKRLDLDVQREILVSMAAHGWWEAYNEAVPEPFPTSFADVSSHLFHSSYTPALYYIAGSRYCRLLGVHSLLGQYYAMRALSLVITAVTFGLVVRAAREWFDDDIALAAGVVVAALPQFALIGIAVSPDPLVFLLGAVVWWQAARLFAAKSYAVSVITMIGATAAAVLSKQIAAPLIGHTTLLVALGTVGVVQQRGIERFLKVVALAVSGAAGVLLVSVVADVELWNGARNLFQRLQDADRNVLPTVRAFFWSHPEGTVVLDWNYFLRFSGVMFSSGYVTAGWMRFWAPPWIYMMAATIAAFGVIRGVGLIFFERDGRFRCGMLVALLVVTVQLAAVYGTRLYFPGSGIQGRYLFLALGPFASLWAIGLVRWRDEGTRSVMTGLSIAALVALDAVAWATTVVPAYQR